MCDRLIIIVRVDKMPDPVLNRLWTKVYETFEQWSRPFLLSSAFAWLSVSRFIQKIFAIKCQSRRKTEKYKSFSTAIFPEATPTVLQQIVSATNHPPFNKVWLCSVCWSLSATPGNLFIYLLYKSWAKSQNRNTNHTCTEHRQWWRTTNIANNRNNNKIKNNTKLENVAIIAMYCHLRPPDATAFPIQHLSTRRIWAADKSNAVSFRVAVGCHVNAD